MIIISAMIRLGDLRNRVFAMNQGSFFAFESEYFDDARIVQSNDFHSLFQMRQRFLYLLKR